MEKTKNLKESFVSYTEGLFLGIFIGFFLLLLAIVIPIAGLLGLINDKT